MKHLPLNFLCMILQNIFKFQAMNRNSEIITNMESGGKNIKKYLKNESGNCSVNMLIMMLCM